MEDNRVLETKLDILISDFQRFKNEQHEVNKEMAMHANKENSGMARIITTLKWHTVIGTSMATAICGITLKLMSM